MVKFVFEGMSVIGSAPVRMATGPGLVVTPIAGSSGVQTTAAFALIPGIQVALGEASKPAPSTAGLPSDSNAQSTELPVMAWVQFESISVLGRFYWMRRKEQSGRGKRENTPKHWCQTCLSQISEKL